MSTWTYITGTITVAPMGRTQPEKRYILDTILEHQPRVSGSERDMNVYVIQKNGHNTSCSHDEFGEQTNNLISFYGNKSRDGWLNLQDEYILVVDAALRDREFKEAYRDFMKWLVRLGKRVQIEGILVEVKDYYNNALIKDDSFSFRNSFGALFEEPSWYKDSDEVAWAEYLMWDSAKNSRFPMKLEYKYYADEENDREVERRLNYQRGE